MKRCGTISGGKYRVRARATTCRALLPEGEPLGGAALTLSGVRVNVPRRRVAFTVSYASTVRVRVAKRVHSSWRLLRAFDVDASGGANRVAIRPRALVPGRYRVGLAARDGAGNSSAALLAPFRIERRSPAQR